MTKLRFFSLTRLLALGTLTACATVPHTGPPPPRLREPESGSAVQKTRRPEIRWALARGTEGAAVKLCRDEKCVEVIESAEVMGQRWTPSVDLPSGKLHLFLAGLHAGARTEPPLHEEFFSDVKTKLETPHFALYVPVEARAVAERLSEMGERAVRFYARLFSCPAPKVSLQLYSAIDRFREAQVELGGRLSKQHVGFTTATGSIHMAMFPRVERSVEGGDGFIERVAMHEIAHAFQRIWSEDYAQQPGWLVEGLADLLAERAVTDTPDAVPPPNPHQSDRVRIVRRALAEHHFISVEDLLLDPYSSWASPDGRDVGLHYAEAYCLVRLLDGADHPERQKQFRELAAKALRMGGIAVAERINHALRKIIGDQAAFERELEDWVRTTPLYPWEAVEGDLRPLDGGRFVLDTGRKQGGVALAEERAQVGDQLEVDAQSLDAKEVGIVFAYHSAEDFWVFSHVGKRLVLSHFDGRRFHPLTSRPIAANDNPVHHLSLKIADHQVTVRADDAPDWTQYLVDEVHGRWGVFDHDGAVRFDRAERK